MPSSLFPSNSGGIFNEIDTLRRMVGGDPQAAYAHMYQTNPQFRQFADSVNGKTPEQAFRQYGLDFNQYRNLM